MQTRTKLLAAFLAVALPAAALAQEAAKPAPPPEAKTTVTVYGTINANLHNSSASGLNAAGDVDGRWAVSLDSSNVGFRGTLEALPWIGATFQCETAANVDGLSLAALCNRNSRVGVTGKSWGTLWLGNWDTPVKAGAYGTKADDPFGNTDVFGHQNIMGSPGFRYRSSAWKAAAGDIVGGFDVRASNSVGYWTPKFANMVSAKVQYSVNELAAADTSPDNAADPTLLAAVLNVDYGPLSVFGSFERHEDAYALANANGAVGAAFGSTAANANNVSSTDQIFRVGAGYELATGFGTLTPVAWFEQLTLQQDDAPAGAVTEYKRFAWMAGLKYRMNSHELRFRYSMADDGDCELAGGATCNTDDYGASNIVVGYAWHMHKMAQLYAFWSKIDNKDNARYTFSISGSPAVVAPASGADLQAFGAGIRYAF
jgi:predicted porin